MQKKKITTVLGEIAVTIDDRGSDQPVVFLHGVFLDHTLWSGYPSDFTGRTHIYIDMPAHGESSDVGRDWELEECVTMLMQVLDSLNVQTCIAIGQSWGSMTALRAAKKHPDRFSALGLFNMPFKKTTGWRKSGFSLQKLLLVFPGFYAKQAAKSLYSKEILRDRPELSNQMQQRLIKRSSKELSRVIDAVILKPDDASELIEKLQVPALAVIGREDYVGKPPRLEVWTVSGGHISPQEAVEKIQEAILKIISLSH